MITLDIKTNPRTGQLIRKVQFSNGSVVSVYGDISLQTVQMESIGEYSIGLIKARARAGIGSNDAPMPGLSRGYARRKSRAGRGSSRDLTFTGEMLDALTVRSVSARQVRADITTASARIKAEANEQVSPWYGWSPADLSKIEAYATALIDGNAENAVRLLEAPAESVVIQMPARYPERMALARMAA
jgi:hypothetical protein